MIGTIHRLIDLLYPRYCVVCDGRLLTEERYVCLRCLSRLPRTRFHLQPGNRLEQLFWGRADVERAASLFYYYRDNDSCRILHELKYHRAPRLGVHLGWQMAMELAPSGFFEPIEVLVPVPLAAPKQRARGYNQCERIVRGIADVTGLPVDTHSLVRTVANSTQTKKRREERWTNVQGIFAVTDPGRLAGRHILLVDDVVTTGSTLISCIGALSVVSGIRVSVLTLAMARE